MDHDDTITTSKGTPVGASDRLSRTTAKDAVFSPDSKQPQVIAATTRSIIMPPKPVNASGRPRRMGVEIEFAGLETEDAAKVVQNVFGGMIVSLDKHARRVETDLGDFVVELDVSRAHPAKAGKPGNGPDHPEDGKSALWSEMETQVASAVGDIVRYWMPQEIATPPVAISDLDKFDRLIAALRHHGALGTEASALYGFGLHLNPEVPDTDRPSVLAHLKAYLLCSDWLHGQVDMDITRRIMRFVAPFPQSYVRMVVDPDYDPSLPDMIVDYFRFNPSRNREFDMLPLFAHLDRRRVSALASGKSAVKARPTFHYRLPNSLVDLESWGGIVEEWNRWVRVEWLAADTNALRAAGKRWCHLYDSGRASIWKEEAANWLVTPLDP